MDNLFYLLIAAIFTYVFTRIPFVRNAGLSRAEIILFFTLRLAASLVLAWFTSAATTIDTDYGTLNYYGSAEYNNLLRTPSAFLRDIYHSPYGHYGGFFDSSHSFWNNLKNNLILKALAVLDLLTNGNYYLNAIFFNACVFIGQVSLYRVFNHYFPNARKAMKLCCFLIPSVVYFTSGIHKDAIVFTTLCTFIYAVYFSLYQGVTLRRTILSIISLFILLLMRNYVAVLLLPCLAVWILSERSKLGPWLSALTVFGIMAIGAWTLHMFTSFNVLTILSNRQQDFISTAANTDLTHQLLQPTVRSMLSFLPWAANAGLLRPYPMEFSGVINAVAAEWYLCLSLLVTAGWFAIRKRTPIRPFSFFLILFGLVMIMVIGFTIPNAGSIIRYRSLYIPFLLAPCLYFLAEVNIIKRYI